MNIIHATDNTKPVAGIYNFLKTMGSGTFLLYKNVPVITKSIDKTGVAGWRVVISELRKCDILHFHTAPPIGLSIVAKLCGAKIVRTEHYIGGPTERRRKLKIAGAEIFLIKIRNYLIRNFLVDRWVAVSELCSQYVESRWGANAQVIYNGIDTDFFQPPTDKAEIRRRLGLGDERIFIAVGQLVERKRFAELIEDFKEVPGTLLIVGDGPMRAQLSGRNVRLLGQLDRNGVLAALQASDVFVHAAVFEAFGLVVAEAQAVGLPAIVIEGSGAAEIVEHGVTGQVVPPDRLAQAMSEISITGSPRQRAVQCFSAHRMREDYKSLYSCLLQKTK